MIHEVITGCQQPYRQGAITHLAWTYFPDVDEELESVVVLSKVPYLMECLSEPYLLSGHVSLGRLTLAFTDEAGQHGTENVGNCHKKVENQRREIVCRSSHNPKMAPSLRVSMYLNSAVSRYLNLNLGYTGLCTTP